MLDRKFAQSCVGRDSKRQHRHPESAKRNPVCLFRQTVAFARDVAVDLPLRSVDKRFLRSEPLPNDWSLPLSVFSFREVTSRLLDAGSRALVADRLIVGPDLSGKHPRILTAHAAESIRLNVRAAA